MDSRGSYVSKILYVKTKESGPLGGVRRASANVDPQYGTVNFYIMFLGNHVLQLLYVYMFRGQSMTTTLKRLFFFFF